MNNPELTQYLRQAQALLASGQADRQAYDQIEKYALANVSRLSADPDYRLLKETLTSIAAKYGYPDLDTIREHFGLNSCAQ